MTDASPSALQIPFQLQEVSCMQIQVSTQMLYKSTQMVLHASVYLEITDAFLPTLPILSLL